MRGPGSWSSFERNISTPHKWKSALHTMGVLPLASHSPDFSPSRKMEWSLFHGPLPCMQSVWSFVTLCCTLFFINPLLQNSLWLQHMISHLHEIMKYKFETNHHESYHWVAACSSKGLIFFLYSLVMQVNKGLCCGSACVAGCSHPSWSS